MLRLPIDQRYNNGHAVKGASAVGQGRAPEMMQCVTQVETQSDVVNEGAMVGSEEVALPADLKFSVKNTFINVSGADSEQLGTRSTQSCVARLSEPNPKLFPAKVSHANYIGGRPGEVTPGSTVAPEDLPGPLSSSAGDEESEDDESKKLLAMAMPPRLRHTGLGGSTPLAAFPPVKEIDEEASFTPETSQTRSDGEDVARAPGSVGRSSGSRLPVSEVPEVKNTFLHFKQKDSETPKGSQTCTARISCTSSNPIFTQCIEEEDECSRPSKSSTWSAMPREEVEDEPLEADRDSPTASTEPASLRLLQDVPGTPFDSYALHSYVTSPGQTRNGLGSEALRQLLASQDERLPVDLSRCVSPGATPLATPLGRTPYMDGGRFLAGRDFQLSEDLGSLREERSASMQSSSDGLQELATSYLGATMQPTSSVTSQASATAAEPAGSVQSFAGDAASAGALPGQQAKCFDTAEELSPKVPPPAYKAPTLPQWTATQDVPPPPPTVSASLDGPYRSQEAAVTGRPILADTMSRVDHVQGPASPSQVSEHASATARPGRLGAVMPPTAESAACHEQSCGSPLSYPPPVGRHATSPPVSPGRAGRGPVSPPGSPPMPPPGQALHYMPAGTSGPQQSLLATGTPAAPHGAAMNGAPGGHSTSSSFPSLGSQSHGFVDKDGQPACRPCAWFQKDGNCLNGGTCGFCHLCPPGELKNRKKQKIARFRKMEAAGTLAPPASRAGGRLVAQPS